jgi:general secretion pathway protein D
MGNLGDRICVGPHRSGIECKARTTLGNSMNRLAAVATAYRLTFRIALFLMVVLIVALSTSLHAQSAKNYYKEGQKAEAHEDYDAAFNAYQKAYSMDPKDLTYKNAYYRVMVPTVALHMKNGRRLFQSGDEQGALTEFLRASSIDPSDEAAGQEIAKIRALHQEKLPENVTGVPQPSGNEAELESMAGPTQLKPISNEPLTLHMVEDSKIVYQAVAKAAGINVLFDPEYTSKRIQVDLNNVSLMEALRIVSTLSGTFWKPVTNNTIFVAANTRSKRTELEEQAVQTFYLTNAWQQNDGQDVNTAIRNVLPNSHAYLVASQNAIVMRGTPDELLLAQKIVDDLDKARPEVLVDISVLEVSKNWERTIGIAWPQSASIQLMNPSCSTSSSSSSSTTTSSTCTPTLYNLAHLNSSDFAVTIGAATVNLLLNDSNTKILENPRIRSTDAQKATMKIGTRIPIATGSFQSGVGVAAAVTPLAETQFQYIDVGVVIDMTPTVHYNHDVTMKLAIEVSSESGSVTISGVTEPIIAQKKSEQTIRLREGEAAILGGLLNQQEIVSWTGIPGLSSIPILKYLFGSKDHQKTDDEIVFLLMPHVVRSPYLSPVNLRPIDTGAGPSIELRHISVDGAGPISAIQPARPAVEPALGTVPGQSSAAAAAPQALAQMRQSAEAGPSTAPPNTAMAAPSSPGQAAPAQSAAPPGPGALRISLVPSSGSTVANGTTFQVPVVITGARDIASVPLEVHYDPAKLALVNVGDGDFLGRDGQAVALVHRDDGQGDIRVNASRPPGAPGVSGAGVVCVLSFQTKAAGDTTIRLQPPAPVTSGQQQVQADAAQTTITVK